jgi:hypothetical protein
MPEVVVVPWLMFQVLEVESTGSETCPEGAYVARPNEVYFRWGFRVCEYETQLVMPAVWLWVGKWVGARVGRRRDRVAHSTLSA